MYVCVFLYHMIYWEKILWKASKNIRQVLALLNMLCFSKVSKWITLINPSCLFLYFFSIWFSYRVQAVRAGVFFHPPSVTHERHVASKGWSSSLKKPMENCPLPPGEPEADLFPHIILILQNVIMQASTSTYMSSPISTSGAATRLKLPPGWEVLESGPL